MNLGEIVGKPAVEYLEAKSLVLVDPRTFIGIEVEVEGMKKPIPAGLHEDLLNKGRWVVTEDSSLRNGGREFIMKSNITGQPIGGRQVDHALKDFDRFMKDFSNVSKSPIETSTRTSTHIHLDARDLTLAQFKKFIILYYTFEDILFSWIGVERVKSQYCRPARYHSDIIDRVSTVLRTPDDGHIDFNLGNKYDALNFLALQQHGTIEVRAMVACLEGDTLLTWLNMLLCLRVACRDESIIIEEFPEMVSINGMEKFLESIFNGYSGELLKTSNELDILEGVRLAQKLLMISTAKKSGIKHSSYGTIKSGGSNRFHAFKEKFTEEK